MSFVEHQHPEGIGPDGSRASASGHLFLSGPQIDVAIELPEVMAKALGKLGKATPEPIVGRALIDTGSMRSVVDESVCVALGAAESGTELLDRESGRVVATCYSVKQSFSAGWTPPVLYLRMAALDLGFDPDSQPMLCVLGRDYLADKMMIYNGRRGRFELHK